LRYDIQIFDRRDFGFVSPVVTFEDVRDKVGIDISKIFNGLVLDLRVFDSDWSLENTDTPRVLIENSFNIFSCP